MKAKTLIMAILMSGLLAACMTSCSTKKQAIKDLESLSVDLRDNSKKYSVADWQVAVERFIKCREKISKYEFD